MSKELLTLLYVGASSGGGGGGLNPGDPISLLTNDAGYLVSGANISLLVNNSGYQVAADVIAYAAPIVHTHTIANVTDLQSTLNGKAALSHTHLISEVTNLQTTLDGKASTSHSHAIGDVTNLQTSLDGKAAISHSHVIGDVTNLQSSLDDKADLVGGVIPTSQLPAIAIGEYFEAVNEAAMLALSGADRGDICFRTDNNFTYWLADDDETILANWKQLTSAAGGVTSVNGFSGVVVLSPGDIGAATSAQGALADTALQSADIDTLAELNAIIGDATLVDANHTHTIANVTGLQTALDGKAASSHSHAISDVTNLQTTLDGKAASSHTHTLADITDSGALAGLSVVAVGLIDATGTPDSSTFLRGDGTWAAPAGGGGGDLLASNNLSDLASIPTARTNLGLGTAALSATGDFATSAQGTLADSATQPGDNVSDLANDAGYLVAGDNVSVLLNDASYVASGNNISELANDAGYLVAADITNKADLVGGVIPTAQIPSIAIGEYFEAVDQTAMLALSGADRGDICYRTDTEQIYWLSADDETTLSNWKTIALPAANVVSVNGYSGVVVLSPGDIGAAPVAHTHLLADITDAGSAAGALITDFATSAQGDTADSAMQPGDAISLLSNDAGYVTGWSDAGFSGNLAVGDDTLQEVFDKLDALPTGTSSWLTITETDITATHRYYGGLTPGSAWQINRYDKATLTKTVANIGNNAGQPDLATAWGNRLTLTYA